MLKLLRNEAQVPAAWITAALFLIFGAGWFAAAANNTGVTLLLFGWLFAAILSFNEFTASLFVTAQRTQTLPVAMYNYVREFADPSMAALSVMYIVGTAALITFANVFLGLGKVLKIEQSR